MSQVKDILSDMAAIFDIQTGTQINAVVHIEDYTAEHELHQRLRSMPTGRDYRAMQRVYLFRRLAVIAVALVLAFVVWQIAYTGFGPETWDAIPAAGALHTP